MPIHPGHNGGGRPSGVRNALSRAFLEDLHSNWKEHGAKTIEIVRKHHPEIYVHVVAGVLPKEFIFENALVDIDDDELLRITERLRIEVLEEQQQVPLLELKAETTNVEESGSTGAARGRDPASKDGE